MMRNGIELYLVRHAIAAERGTAWPDDRLRPLTRHGIERFTQVVRGLTKLDIKVEVVYTSPLTRARQTAELLAEGLAEPPLLKVMRALEPGAAPEDVVAALRTRSRRVALVGHEPDLGRLAAFLIGASTPLAFKKGGVCRIDLTVPVRKGHGSLVWFAPPRFLRR